MFASETYSKAHSFYCGSKLWYLNNKADAVSAMSHMHLINIFSAAKSNHTSARPENKSKR
jgi:hypothetical protein